MSITRLGTYSQIKGSSYKLPCKVATSSSITLSGGAPLIVDNYTLTTNDRVLVVSQSTATENGIYNVQSTGSGADGTWVRAVDFSSNEDAFQGTQVRITSGSVGSGKAYSLITSVPITLDSTSLTFTEATPPTIGYSMQAIAHSIANFTWADSTVYYIGAGHSLNLANVQGRGELFIPKAGTIKAVYVYSSFSTAGSAESWDMDILINGASATNISSTAVATATRTWTNTALSIPVAAGDYFEIRSNAVVWATQPVANAGYGINAVIYIE